MFATRDGWLREFALKLTAIIKYVFEVVEAATGVKPPNTMKPYDDKFFLPIAERVFLR